MSRLRVVLAAPPFEDLDAPGDRVHMPNAPNLGLYLLAALARRDGHQVKVIDPLDFADSFREEGLFATLQGVDVLGVSATSSTWPRIKAALGLMTARPRPVIVLGGAHPSSFDEHVLRAARVDYVVRGEGDKSFPALLRALAENTDPAEVPGVSFLRDGSLVRVEAGPLLTPAELAELPLPAWDLMPPGYYKLLPVESSRGCYYSCIFCTVTFRRRWRGLDVPAFLDRLERLKPFLGMVTEGAYFIVDDCFTADYPRLCGISEGLVTGSGEVCFEARITDLIEPGVMEAVSRMPVKVMEMGVECGYEEGLKKVGKRLSLDEVEKAAGLLKEAGLGPRSRFSFVLGLPWEGRPEVLKTVEYAFKLCGRLDARMVAAWLTVFPGSIIWKRQKEWGIDIRMDDYDQEHWWRGEEIFRRTHPLLDPEKDVDAVVTYARLMKRLFPNIGHDWGLRYFD